MKYDTLTAEQKLARYEINRQAQLQRKRDWQDLNREKYNEDNKTYYQMNKDKLKAAAKANYQKKKELKRQQVAEEHVIL